MEIGKELSSENMCTHSEWKKRKKKFGRDLEKKAFVFVSAALCLQGWLPRYSADMQPVMWQMFHLCTMEDGEALQREEGGKGKLSQKHPQSKLFLANENPLCLPRHPGIPNHSCKLCTVSCLIIPDVSFHAPFFFVSLYLFRFCPLLSSRFL